MRLWRFYVMQAYRQSNTELAPDVSLELLVDVHVALNRILRVVKALYGVANAGHS